MNILLFVTTLIMVMGILTYAKLETFISTSAIQTEFNNYMKNVERSPISKQADWIYANNIASKAPQHQTRPSTVLSRISFKVFIDQAYLQAHQNEINQITPLTKRLIDLLYHDQQFYKDAIKSNPNIVEALLDKIYNASIALPPKKKITQAEDLANLNLQDPELSLFLYKILNGTHTKEQLAKLNQVPLVPANIEERGEDDIQESEDPDEEEYQTPTGYRSLLDFITLKESPKLRIYLAPREILMVLFGDKQTVDAIIAKRNELYRAVTSGGASPMTPKVAEDEFQSLFKSRALQEFDQNYLDFTVSKTNPRTYD